MRFASTLFSVFLLALHLSDVQAAIIQPSPDAPFIATGSTVPRTRADRAGDVANAADFGAVGNGVTDDTAALQNALNSVSSAGGGIVWLGRKRYAIGGAADLTIPSGVSLSCYAPLVGNANPSDYTATKSVLIINAAHKVVMNNGSGWRNCAALAAGVANLATPSTIRAGLNVHAAFAGTAIQASSDVSIERAFIGGFSTGIFSSHGARTHITETNIDADVCVNSDHSHDISHYNVIHCYPFMTSGNALGTVGVTVSAIADNGAGLYRLTTSGAHQIVTGDTVYVSNAATTNGAQSANGKWTATVIDSTHVDLQGSSSAPTVVTGNAGGVFPAITSLSATANIAAGQTVTGTNVPGGTTVSVAWPRQNTVGLSANSTGSTTGATYTFTDSAYSAGTATVYLDSTQRSGDGFVFTNSEGTTGSDVFVYGHSIGFHMGVAAGWTHLNTIAVDQDNALRDPSTTCIAIDSTAYATTISAGSTSSCWTPLLVNASGGNNLTHTISGLSLSGNGPIAELDQGRVVLMGNSGNGGNILVADGVGNVSALGNDLSNKYWFQTGNGKLKLFGVGNVTATNTFQGTLAYPGIVSLGGGGGACGPGVTCYTQINGAVLNGTIGSSAITNAGSASVSGNSSAVILTGSGTVATFTVTLPGIGFSGQTIDIYFAAAVTTLTWAGATVVGPTTIVANTWHHCVSDSGRVSFYCS